MISNSDLEGTSCLKKGCISPQVSSLNIPASAPEFRKEERDTRSEDLPIIPGHPESSLGAMKIGTKYATNEAAHSNIQDSTSGAKKGSDRKAETGSKDLSDISDRKSSDHLKDSSSAMKIDAKYASQSSSLSISASVRNQERPNKVVVKDNTTRISGEKRANDSLEDSASTSGALKIDAEHSAIKDSTSGAEKKGSDYKATISDSVSLNNSEDSKDDMNTDAEKFSGSNIISSINEVGKELPNEAGKKRDIGSVIGRVTDPFNDLARASLEGFNIKSEAATKSLSSNTPASAIIVSNEEGSTQKKARPLSESPVSSAIGKGNI
jgi:hypothetical protein